MREGNIPGLGHVLIKKDKLISKMKENLGKHKAEFEEAHAAWRAKAVDALRAEIAKAEKGEKFSLNDIGIRNELPEPENHAKDYESVIEMMEISEDNAYVLSRREFNTYVRDEWDWTDHFKGVTRNYSGG